MGSKMSNTEWGLFIGALATVDLVQFILDTFVIGIVANRFIDLVVGMALPFYLRMRGVKLDSKKVGGMVGVFLLEMIPGLDALPLWCLDGFMNYALDKADKKLHEWQELDNPEFNPNNFYRVVNEAGFNDFQNRGTLRSSPTGTAPYMAGKFDIGHRPTPFPSFSKGGPDLGYLQPDGDNYIFETAKPMYKRGNTNPATGEQIKGRHWAYRHIDDQTGKIVKEIPHDMVENIYKVDKQGKVFKKASPTPPKK